MSVWTTKAAQQGVSRDEVNAQVGRNVAIRRPVAPEELAWLTAYLCSPKAECVTGEMIAAGGGAVGAVHQ